MTAGWMVSAILIDLLNCADVEISGKTAGRNIHL